MMYNGIVVDDDDNDGSVVDNDDGLIELIQNT